ncbi:hypothetical protein NG764_11615 [Aliarcobacter cryaerophilus]|jgi:DNA-binding transcriptional MerR regulator|uniref:hypothetical protein n=1 Tax=Aliarcobacter cryaerophilus TaxID=28198 RepID=UPI003DA1F135
MRTVKLNIKDNIYQNVMFVLESFKEKGVQIEEITKLNKNQKDKETLKDFLTNSKIEVFKNIKDPIAWQKSIRDEWN